MTKNIYNNQPKHPTEKLLVISENQELSVFLRDELTKNTFNHPLKVDYCYTSLNNDPKPMIEIGAKEINLKDIRTVEQILKEYDLVFSIHCKQIFPKQLVDNICCINFHPGFNPYNRGWYPQAFSIINGLPIGATIHLMDSEVDHGEIIAQKDVQINMQDTSLEVYKKVIAAEKELIQKNIFNIIEGSFTTTKPTEEGNYNGIKDYKKICELNLESIGSLKNHINLLRATTHGNFNNAYFYGKDGKKYFIRISITEEAS